MFKKIILGATALSAIAMFGTGVASAETVIKQISPSVFVIGEPAKAPVAMPDPAMPQAATMAKAGPEKNVNDMTLDEIVGERRLDIGVTPLDRQAPDTAENGADESDDGANEDVASEETTDEDVAAEDNSEEATDVAIEDDADAAEEEPVDVSDSGAEEDVDHDVETAAVEAASTDKPMLAGSDLRGSE